MKNAEFLVILAANANKTKNLRGCVSPWPPSISRVPDEISKEFGRIIALIQAKINEGHLCNKDAECLLLYNFQPIHFGKDTTYYSLDALRKPLNEITKIHEKIGEPIQLAINGKTGEIINNSKLMVEMELATSQEIADEGLEVPKSYGTYHDYQAPCTFFPVQSDSPLSAEELFKGVYDKSPAIQESKASENLSAALDLLAKSKAAGRYLLELPFPTSEIPLLKERGLGKEVIKFIDYTTHTLVVNCDPVILAKEKPIEDELTRFKMAFNIEETESSKKARQAAIKKAERPFTSSAPRFSESMSVVGFPHTISSSSSSLSHSQPPTAGYKEPMTRPSK